jgi:DNA-directed RNA polymerase specialized sigma24 family protein
VLADGGFASFYRDEYRPVVLYLLKSGARGAEAEDAVQEAMSRAYRNWDGIVSPRAWVRKAAFSCYLRQKRKVSKETRTAEPAPLVTDRESPDDESYLEEQLRVVALMRRLPPQQRQVAAPFYDGWEPSHRMRGKEKS